MPFFLFFFFWFASCVHFIVPDPAGKSFDITYRLNHPLINGAEHIAVGIGSLAYLQIFVTAIKNSNQENIKVYLNEGRQRKLKNAASVNGHRSHTAQNKNEIRTFASLIAVYPLRYINGMSDFVTLRR